MYKYHPEILKHELSQFGKSYESGWDTENFDKDRIQEQFNYRLVASTSMEEVYKQHGIKAMLVNGLWNNRSWASVTGMYVGVPVLAYCGWKYRKEIAEMSKNGMQNIWQKMKLSWGKKILLRRTLL